MSLPMEKMDVIPLTVGGGTPSTTTTTTTTTSAPSLQIGGPGYGMIPTLPKPCMEAKPDLLAQLGLHPRGQSQYGRDPRRVPVTSPIRAAAAPINTAGISVKQLQAALVSHRLAEAVGEMATIQIRDVLAPVFNPGLATATRQPDQNNNTISRRPTRGGLPVAGPRYGPLGIGRGHGRIIKTGGGGGGAVGSGCHVRGPGRRAGENRRYGKYDRNERAALDAELDQYIAQRNKVGSKEQLDAQLERYRAQSAAVRAKKNCDCQEALVELDRKRAAELAAEEKERENVGLSQLQTSTVGLPTVVDVEKVIQKDVEMNDDGADGDDEDDFDKDIRCLSLDAD